MKNLGQYFHLMFAIVFLAWRQKEVRSIVLDHKIMFLSQKQASFVNKAPELQDKHWGYYIDKNFFIRIKKFL
jgi:hypothetical protein